MASYTDFYCNASTGSNLNSGSTESGTATLTYASGNWVAGTGVFTVASGDPSADGVAVGDFASVYANGSTVTGFVGRVTARDATTITVSLTAKSGTAPANGTGDRTLKIGGCWKGPNGSEMFPFQFLEFAMTNATGDDVYVNMKNGTSYAITAAMTDTGDGPIWYGGYTTTVRDGGKAIIDGGTSGTAYVLLTLANIIPGRSFQNLIFQNNGGSSAASLVNAVNQAHLFLDCDVKNSRGAGLVQGIAIRCTASGCNQNLGSSTAITNCHAFYCEAFDNLGNQGGGFGLGTNTLIGCKAYRNAGYGFMSNGDSRHVAINCDAYNNGRSGFAHLGTGSYVTNHINCNAVANTEYGFFYAGTNGRRGVLYNCGFGTGTMANLSGKTNISSSIAAGIQELDCVDYPLNTSPFRDATNGDFTIVIPSARNRGFGGYDIGAVPSLSDLGISKGRAIGGL